jgi:hypothetical protein
VATVFWGSLRSSFFTFGGLPARLSIDDEAVVLSVPWRRGDLNRLGRGCGHLEVWPRLRGRCLVFIDADGQPLRGEFLPMLFNSIDAVAEACSAHGWQVKRPGADSP